MSLFEVDFRRFVDNELAAMRRLPKWRDYSYSIVRPFQVWYDLFLGKRMKYLRRRYCDGSVISLISLVYLEIGVVINISDNETVDIETAYLSTENEIVTCYISTETEEATMYLGTGTELSDIDYLIEIKSEIAETVREATIERIRALIALYNSAGFSFDILY